MSRIPLDLQNKLIEASASNIAQALLSLKGKPLSLDNHLPFRTVYDVDPPMVIGKAGRQIGKSVGLSAILVTKGISQNYFNSLYMTPSAIQTKRFSTQYLDQFMDSKLIAKYFRAKDTVKNVFEKSFTNGSRVYLSYAETESDADRIRGIAGDALYFDEVQDISYDALPAIYETLSGSIHRYKRLFGTSKSTANTLEKLWLRSNQLEWIIKCPHCNKHSVPNTFENCFVMCSGKKGPQCMHCQKTLDVNTGKWVSFAPSIKDCFGFHLPQFLMKANTSERNWTDMYNKIHYSDYGPVKISNEVFGIATDLAGKTLSQKECMMCSNENWENWDTKWVYDSRVISTVVIGVDWSVTGSEKSFTVVSVLGYTPQGKCYVLYSQKLQGIHILDQVDRVLQLYHMYQAQIISSDRGVGVLQVQLMQQKLGHDKVIPVNYVAAKTKLRWDAVGQFLAADRTQAIDNVVMKVRKGRDRIEVPCWKLTSSFWEDALSIYEEENFDGSRRLYRRDPDIPDDWFHSLVFGNIGYQYLTGDFTFTE